jgi:3',5'-cyclic AMP phosphodiesterase CpdA
MTTKTKFMLLADPQFGMAAHLLRKLEGRTAPLHPGEIVAPVGSPESGWPYEQQRLFLAIKLANDLKPDFVAVLGDMVMQWNNNEQIESVKETVASLSPSIPLYWIPGNHDVGVDFLSATDESLAAYRAHFGPDRYSFTTGTCRFMVFNSALFDKPDSARSEYEAQIAWLEQELAIPLPDGVHHTVAFAHHPPFSREIGEEDGTFNLPGPQRRQLIDLLARTGVEYYFAGHTHANIIARHQSLRVIATSAIGVTRSGRTGGYRLVEANSESISHSFHILA